MNPSTLPETGNQLDTRAVVQEEPVQPKAGGDATSVPQPNYPFPPSSPEFTDLLMECFIRGRNAAIDLLEAEQAAALAGKEANAL